MNEDETDVLVVGGGPVGMMMGLLLAKGGVRSIIVEKRTGLHQMPQAHVISTRSMEICRTAGVSEAAMRSQATQPQDMAHVRWVSTLAEPDLGAYALVRGPEAAAAMLRQSPTPICNLSQHLFEPILLDAVQRTEMIDLRFAHEWSAFERTSDGFRSRIHAGGGAPLAVRSRYLIGADGAGSNVRKALGIAMRGPERLAAYCNLFFSANLRPLLAERPALLYWVMDPEFAGVFIAHNIESTWIYMKNLDLEGPAPEAFSPDECRRLIRGAIGAEAAFELHGASPWTMTAQVADSYGGDGAFLIGDAAHRFPPTGGIGMNTGIGDAHNLAWRIAFAERGLGADLPNGYEAERRPVAQTNCEQSASNFHKLKQVAQAMNLSADMEASRCAISLMQRDGGDAEPLDAAFNKAFDLANQPLLVRPDGHIGWRGGLNRRPQAELGPALRRILGGGGN